MEHLQPPQTAGMQPFLLPWSTDDAHGPVAFGPDGPWQALMFEAGNVLVEPGVGFQPTWQAAYPCSVQHTQVVSKALGGSYAIPNSNTAAPLHPAVGPPLDWWALPMEGQYSLGADAYDVVRFSPSNGNVSFEANATIFEARWAWQVTLPEGRTYPRSHVGVLGLGPTWDGWDPIGSPPPSIPQQMVNAGLIESASMGLHIGSVPMKIPGSMALGGYDVARALGPVVPFPYEMGTPFAALLDINLGWETGDSPFDTDDLQHLFHGHEKSNQQAEFMREWYRAPPNSSIVVPNPVLSSISLPPGNCANIAQRLPVTWRQDIGYYLWNTDDPRYTRIINSPAWLQFVLSNPAGTELSIKVPFKLLNLTLESPIVDEPTPYFPCRNYDTVFGWYGLGRAFLQAAFFALNDDTNHVFLAQAPGPDLPPSELRSISPHTIALDSLPMEEFQKSWANHWKPTTVEPAPAPWSGCMKGACSILPRMDYRFVLLALVALGIGWWRARRSKSRAHVVSNTLYSERRLYLPK